MSMTDPIADFLTRIRNGILVRKDEVQAPRSKMKLRIAEILKEEGYLNDVSNWDDKQQGVVSVKIRYGSTEPAIHGIRRVSRPGQRKYVKATDVPSVKGGLGVAIISTSKGVMTDKSARKEGVGGEVICEVW